MGCHVSKQNTEKTIKSPNTCQTKERETRFTSIDVDPKLFTQIYDFSIQKMTRIPVLSTIRISNLYELESSSIISRRKIKSNQNV